MRAVVESLQQLALVNGQMCRVWEGISEGGSKLYLFVAFASFDAKEEEGEAVTQAMTETHGVCDVRFIDALDVV